ncbi:hypothetical protein INT46_008252 [Mucor plumbeus]|uniref:CsbD-like domain-containing protein n=1 Tax=Mucor plumbeus TaxID=97098 RepID=A0A8H7UX31_9FUNG|nr:hypothetical protein INT46_008252 [Mucor plumbeus]
MSSPSKTEAKKDQFVGNVKENVGSAVGNESLEAKGTAQKSDGNVQEIAANVQHFVQGAYDQAAGAVQGVVDSITGNNSGEAEAKVQEKKGEAERKINT